MRYHAALAVLVGAVYANPVPQGFDFDAIDDLDDLPAPVIPVVDAAAAVTTVSYAPSAAAASVSTAVQANPTDATLKVRTTTPDDSQCAVQPTSDDTPANFAANQVYQQNSLTAVTPSGYSVVYKNQTGSTEGPYGYMGYTTLQSYDVGSCAASCTAVNGCMSFNIYYERDPSVDPGQGCTNPPSQVVIKCVYYGAPIQPGSATNVGQWRNDFQVLISGSNGYVNTTVSTPAGYSPSGVLGSAAINAPNDCGGHNTYMGVKMFNSGPFDVSLCAAACSSQSAYNLRHPPANAPAQTCQFFNTYILYNNSVAVGQYCSLYNETWPASYATNTGQYRGKDHFTIGYSFGFSNTTGGADQPSGCTNKASP